MADVPENQPIINWTHHTLTLNICNQMVNADINNQKEKFYKATVWFLRMLIPYLSDSEREKLEADFKLLEAEVLRIKKESSENDVSQSTQILALKEHFANSHAPLGFVTFNRSGIVFVSDDGELDFDKLALGAAAKIVQTPFPIGLDSSIKKEVDEEEKEEKEEPKEDEAAKEEDV